jgi:hypothetical protein
MVRNRARVRKRVVRPLGEMAMLAIANGGNLIAREPVYLYTFAMKKLLLWPVVLLCLVFNASAQLGPNKVQISVQKKNGEGKTAAGEAGITTSKAAEKYTYDITVQNRTSADLTN